MEWIAGYVAIGAAVGFFAGLLGIGGGAIMVPLLVMLFEAQGLPREHVLHLAVGSGMATILFTAASSARSHAARGAVRRFVHAGGRIGANARPPANRENASPGHAPRAGSHRPGRLAWLARGPTALPVRLAAWFLHAEHCPAKRLHAKPATPARSTQRTQVQRAHSPVLHVVRRSKILKSAFGATSPRRRQLSLRLAPTSRGSMKAVSSVHCVAQVRKHASSPLPFCL